MFWEIQLKPPFFRDKNKDAGSWWNRSMCQLCRDGTGKREFRDIETQVSCRDFFPTPLIYSIKYVQTKEIYKKEIWLLKFMMLPKIMNLFHFQNVKSFTVQWMLKGVGNFFVLVSNIFVFIYMCMHIVWENLYIS